MRTTWVTRDSICRSKVKVTGPLKAVTDYEPEGLRTSNLVQWWSAMTHIDMRGELKVTHKISCFHSNCLEFQLLPGGFIIQQDGVPVQYTAVKL